MLALQSVKNLLLEDRSIYLNIYLLAFYVLWLPLLSISIISCSSSSDDDPEDILMPDTVDELTEADVVVAGSPWIFDRYELLEVRDRGTSVLTDDDLVMEMESLYADVEIVFRESGTGTETGFDNAPSTFNWILAANGKVMFVDQLGNPLQGPGIFKVEEENISFEFESTVFDEEVNGDIIIYGKVYLKGTE